MTENSIRRSKCSLEIV